MSFRTLRRPLSAALILLVLPLAGCAMRFDASRLGVPVAMAEPMAAPIVGDTFRLNVRATHLFWGLMPAGSPNVRQQLAGQLGTGAAVHNLTITTRKRWSDVLGTVLTLGIISTTTVTFEGVITRGAP